MPDSPPTAAAPVTAPLPTRLGIRTVAVLGAGTMGATLAALCAGAGLAVLVLDRPATEPAAPGGGRSAGPWSDGPQGRNRHAAEGLRRALAASPPAFHVPGLATRIAVGNFADDLPRLARADWVLEAVVEDLSVKRELFAAIAPQLKPDVVLSSNTSGLSAAALAEALPEALRSRFLITHFFNPPRHLHLLELVAAPQTDAALFAAFAAFAEQTLGKGVVVARDTPNFIANRIGTFAFLQLLGVLERGEAGPTELDLLSGELLGRPRSATFRTADLVGLDTLLAVTRHLHATLAHDAQHERFRPSPLLEKLVAAQRLGVKSGAGFYTRAEPAPGGGRGAILELDPARGEYRNTPELDPRSLGPAARLPDVGERIATLIAEGGRPGRLLSEHMLELLDYSARCVPELGEDLVAIDRALRWGFGWELGPFEWWDALGVATLRDRLVAAGRPVPPLVEQLLASGAERFHEIRPGEAGAPPQRTVFAPGSGSHRVVPPRARELDLALLRRAGRVLRHNDEASLLDLGQEVLGVEFHTRRNVLGEGTAEILAAALEQAGRSARGLVIGNEAESFSAGANLKMVMGLVQAGRFDQLERLVAGFQQLNQALRGSLVPVVVATRGLVLGGGCEILLHGARVVAAMESWIGLVEVGVGLIPAAGGCKELVRRLDEELSAEVAPDRLPGVQKLMRVIGQATVSGSALHARELGFLSAADRIVMNREQVLATARDAVVELERDGYRPPLQRQEIRAPGRSVLAALEVGLFNLHAGRHMSSHDLLVTRKLASVLCGGDVLSGTPVSEQQLLDLEREAFLALLGEEPTQQRIVALLTTGKPLRN